MKKGPMPTVTYEGETYKLKSHKTQIPNLLGMERLAALVWLQRNTWPRGYHKSPNPLTGMGGAIGLSQKQYKEDKWKK